MACLLTNLLKSATNVVNKSQIRLGPRCMPCNYDKLKPTSSIGGTGAVFTTKIKRKREIPDPSKPHFDRALEPLRWSDWNMLTDVRRRIVYKKYFPQKNLLECVSDCQLLPSILREEALQQISELGIQKRKNRCVISSRGHGKLLRYRISRHIWRDLADHNLLSGVAKACWG